MFKSLFCNHNFKYYHTSEEIAFLEVSSWESYHYLCEKCGKSKIIYGSYLYDIIKEAKLEESKLELMNHDLSKYDKYYISFGGRYFQGYKAYHIMNCYKDIFKNKLKALDIIENKNKK